MIEMKIIEYKSGVGATHVPISMGLAKTKHVRTIDKMIEFSVPFHEDREYRLAIELRAPCSLRLDSIELICLEPRSGMTGVHVSPYRAFDFQVSKQLEKLNDDMDRMLRHSPEEWLAGMLNVALLMEDYDTSEGLARYAVANFSHDPNALKQLAPLIVQSHVATGKSTEIEMLLLRLSQLGICWDQAISIARRLGNPDQQWDQNFTLPSGAVDLVNLNSALEVGSKPPFHRMLTAAAAANEPELLWANYFRTSAENEYFRQMNLHFGKHNLPFRLDAGAPDENILSRLSIRQERPVSGPANGPLVSVIVAAYNCDATLTYAVQSVLNQTYRNIEVLIADDGSSDRTLERMQVFADDPRVRLFSSEANQGPYNIRNRLIDASRGELITFHDADDLALPHRISAQVEAMISNSATVSLGSWLRMRSNGHIVMFKDGLFTRQCLNSIMYCRSVFEKFGPYRSALCGADSEFYEKIRGQLTKDQITIVKQPVVLGLWSSASLTQTSGFEANELGYRAPSRRAYAAVAARQRILGCEIVPDKKVRQVMRHAGVYRQPQDLIEITNGAELFDEQRADLPIADLDQVKLPQFM